MNESNNRSEFTRLKNARKSAESVRTRSSASIHSRRNDENFEPTGSDRSRQSNTHIRDVPSHPSWLSEVTWNYNGDTSSLRLPEMTHSNENHNYFDHTYVQQNQYDPFGTRDLSPCSYDSHSTRNAQCKYKGNTATYEEPLQFDRWVNEEPIGEITNRAPYFHTTQLIRQTTRDAEKKIIWIYSYKNRNLFQDQCNSESGASTNRSENDGTDQNISFMETGNTGQPGDFIYCIPNHKPFENSLETVEEVIESEKSSESPGLVKNLEEPIEFVKGWTKDSVDSSTLDQLPGEIGDRNRVYVEMHRNRLEVRENAGSLRAERINMADWITRESCVVVNHNEAHKEWRTNKHKDKCVNTENTGDNMLLPARWTLRPHSWEVYYPTSPRHVSEDVNISLTDLEETDNGIWKALSRCFCKEIDNGIMQAISCFFCKCLK